MTALPPGSTIGILGGGQLGRMMSLAAGRLGLKCHIYSDVWGPACDFAAASTIAPYEDTAKIRAFAEAVDVVTYEFENVPLEAAAAAEAVAPVRPGPKALEVAQDRLTEKTFIRDLGIAVAPFAAVDGTTSFDAAAAAIGDAGILKTRRLGYDGKGQVRISSAAELPGAFEALKGMPSILEGLVPFAFEVSVLVVRGVDGETRFYDVPVNTHKDGILDTSTVPSPISPAHAKRATELAASIADALGYVGVLGVGVADHAVSPRDELPGVAVGHVEQPREHADRKVCAHLIDEVELFLRERSIHRLGGDAAQEGLVLGDRLRRELALQHAAKRAVTQPVGLEQRSALVLQVRVDLFEVGELRRREGLGVAQNAHDVVVARHRPEPAVGRFFARPVQAGRCAQLVEEAPGRPVGEVVEVCKGEVGRGRHERLLS